ncbi:hypothetical protein AVEN_164549-1 [Araneus ventricosus]|uniref:Uncharacterized protein n=1 Tax=Araneus ventricosus TaxID=182803 RepID=A0A4Y2B3I2_ARAVE|nr:hypothetical protein AVEN_164549-1 [Araneus ventricosus]
MHTKIFIDKELPREKIRDLCDLMVPKISLSSALTMEQSPSKTQFRHKTHSQLTSKSGFLTAFIRLKSFFKMLFVRRGLRENRNFCVRENFQRVLLPFTSPEALQLQR